MAKIMSESLLIGIMRSDEYMSPCQGMWDMNLCDSSMEYHCNHKTSHTNI